MVSGYRGAMSSQREKKRAIQAGVAKLKAKPGWDPANLERESPEDALDRLAVEAGSEKAYAESELCEACTRRQAEFDDASALCEMHLALAMGL
jgi:hypothetical protein